MLCACSDKGEWQSPHARLTTEKWVAHAGGRINGIDYSNSLEALNSSDQAGMHLVELDFEWTKDHHLVLLHDWDEALEKTYSQIPGQRSLAGFKAFKTSKGLTPMSAQELFVWLDQHPNVLIVTDVKTKQMEALKWIQAHYPSYAERFIPQIYYFGQYEPVRKLGYYRVIFTLYRVRKKPDDEIVAFCKTHAVWAVTMPEKRAQQRKLIQGLRDLHIPVYVHTINDPEKIKSLFAAGVFGVYLDRTDIAMK